MFEGVSDHDQLHQFITSRTSLPLNPLSFPPFHDPYNNPSPPQVFQPAAVPHNQYFTTVHDDQKNGDHEKLVSTNQQRHDDDNVQWTNDEVLALLRIRSGMENWFPDFTWEYVSRKLAEMGFRKTADKCKQKFEEESRYFNNINYTKNYRFFNDPDQDDHQLYQGENHDQISQQKLEKPSCELLEGEEKTGRNLELEKKQVDQESEDQNVVEISKMKKRKIKEKKFEMFKGFCEEFVKKMMDRQEEMHKKLLEDMVKRGEEKIAKEEAWKKYEMERINKELEVMAHEQAIAGDRQAIVIQVLKKFTSSSKFDQTHLFKEKNSPKDPLEVLKNSSNHINPPTSPSTDQANSTSFTNQNDPIIVSSQNPNPTHSLNIPKLPTSSSENIKAPQNPNFMITNQTNPLDPNSFSTKKVTQNPKSNEKDDLGKRWPRDEVLALINLRCSLHSNGEDHKEGIKAPLWERISQGMLVLGYKRSAKRCKEKWENINKYFRKTKDVNKKRSLDSRTCPYFHQLSTLYNQGITFGLENNSGLPENFSELPENVVGEQDLLQTGSTHVSTKQVGEGEKNGPSLDFDF